MDWISRCQVGWPIFFHIFSIFFKILFQVRKNFPCFVCFYLWRRCMERRAAFYFYKYHCRQIFYFESYDSSRICTETRYSEKKSGDEEIRAFVDDLLLGPMTNSFKFLFSPGTRTEFCFSNGKELYVGLSKQALFVNSETFNMKQNACVCGKLAFVCLFYFAVFFPKKNKRS